MKKWQRYWLYLIIIYAAVHLVRDVFQDLGIKNWLSTTFVKAESAKPIYVDIYWGIFNTYIFALSQIVLAVICLKRKKFGKPGYLTIIIAGIISFAWSFYWFFL